jgi:protein subunit release factor A
VVPRNEKPRAICDTSRDPPVARRSMVGSGERAEKVCRYNVPQNRVTDHRIQLTLHKLDRFLDGALEDVIVPLRTHHQAERLRRELGIETGVTTAAMGGGDD